MSTPYYPDTDADAWTHSHSVKAGSTQQKSSKVVAVCCADLHLSLQPPLARAGEEDWLATMRGYFLQLIKIADEYHCPILCAGDIFHHWKAPPELINFALDTLPNMVCIAGQHDMPFHRRDLMGQSAYATLVKADKITDLDWGNLSSECTIWGFPWGSPMRKVDDSDPQRSLAVALVHDYLWVDGKGHPNADPAHHLAAFTAASRLKGNQKFLGYDVVIIGDNHQSWEAKVAGTTFFNCGSFMRRNADQVDHSPRVGLIRADGTVESRYLEVSHDNIVRVDKPEVVEVNEAVQEFLDKLKDLHTQHLDFKESLRQVLEQEKDVLVRQLLVEAMEAT